MEVLKNSFLMAAYPAIRYIFSKGQEAKSKRQFYFADFCPLLSQSENLPFALWKRMPLLSRPQIVNQKTP